MEKTQGLGNGASTGTESDAHFSSRTSTPYRAYDVFVTRQSDTYHPRTYRALLATDGKRHRVAFYWRDPMAECEQADALAFSDFLFRPAQVSYWHHKDPNQQHTLVVEPSPPERAGQFPTDNTLESLLRSILSIIAHNRATPPSNGATLETARFFQVARRHSHFEHTVERPADEAGASSFLEQAQENYTILDRLPFGRNYSKQIDQKGNVLAAECSDPARWHGDHRMHTRVMARLTAPARLCVQV